MLKQTTMVCGKMCKSVVLNKSINFYEICVGTNPNAALCSVCLGTIFSRHRQPGQRCGKKTNDDILMIKTSESNDSTTLRMSMWW